MGYFLLFSDLDVNRIREGRMPREIADEMGEVGALRGQRTVVGDSRFKAFIVIRVQVENASLNFLLEPQRRNEPQTGRDRF